MTEQEFIDRFDNGDVFTKEELASNYWKAPLFVEPNVIETVDILKIGNRYFAFEAKPPYICCEQPYEVIRYNGDFVRKEDK